MTLAADWRSGKDHRGENFPVASRLIQARYRKPILAFYNFVRTADDIADHAALPQAEKLALLDSLEATLLGQSNAEPEAIVLRAALAERSLDPQHARDHLTAFRRDVTQQRYRDWDDLIDYCRYSAMPVGRFVLDVHGEPREIWPANDALCAALQIINHLQDCGKDYRNLNRVYIPLDCFEAHGSSVEDLDKPAATAQLRACLDDMCVRVSGLLRESTVFSAQIANRGLSLEVAVIQRLAERLVRTLQAHDPLSERVHLGRVQVAVLALLGAMQGASQRLASRNRKHVAVANGAVSGSGNAATTASGSSFYLAMRILPHAQRTAMFDIYAFCRAVDDIADEPGNRDERLAQLAQWRRDIAAIYENAAPPQLASLARSVRSFNLAHEDFLAVIDGMEMDVQADIRAPDLATLDLYCDRVASAVGRLSVRIFGMDEKDGIALAHHLGRALQLANTLRDLDEDAVIGRLYLPRDYLDKEGIPIGEPKVVLAHPALPRVCNAMAALATSHFAQADAIMAKAPRASVRAPRIMAEAYRRILRGLIARGWTAPRARVKLGKRQIAQILIRSFVS
jgi:squalene synthase HpnD/squalene synthase HpnC